MLEQNFGSKKKETTLRICKELAELAKELGYT